MYEKYWYSLDAAVDSYEYVDIATFSSYAKFIAMRLFVATNIREMRCTSSLSGPSRVNRKEASSQAVASYR